MATKQTQDEFRAALLAVHQQRLQTLQNQQALLQQIRDALRELVTIAKGTTK